MCAKSWKKICFVRVLHKVTTLVKVTVVSLADPTRTWLYRSNRSNEDSTFSGGPIIDEFGVLVGVVSWG